MEKVRLHVETDVNPTESEERVKKAIWNIFGDVVTQSKPAHKGSILFVDVEGLETLATLKNVLRRDHIRDAARKALFGNIRNGVINFCLNKQVAYVGHVSFSEETAESPLGPIRVEISCENPREIIDWIAPKTTKS